jgi:hypothetical protein
MIHMNANVRGLVGDEVWHAGREASLRVGHGRVDDAPGPARRTRWTYASNVARRPCNLFFLAVFAVLGAVLQSAPLLLVGLCVEVGLLAAASRVGPLRRDVDAHLDGVERAAAQKEREALLSQMGESHRQELSKIESLIDNALANVQRRGGGPGTTAVDAADPAAVRRLIHGYVRLAVAHRVYEESLAATNRHVLEGTIRALEATGASLGDRAHPCLRRRISIAHRRAECWSRARDGMEAIGNQLVTVVELCHLVHQASLLPADVPGVTSEVDRVLAELEHGEGAARELADVDAALAGTDPTGNGG